MNLDMAKQIAQQCGAEAVANPHLPNWSGDDREDIAYYYGVEDWFDIPEDHRDILLTVYREGERAEKAHKNSV